MNSLDTVVTVKMQSSQELAAPNEAYQGIGYANYGESLYEV